MIKDRGDAEGKEEPAVVVGVKGWSAVDGPQVRDGSGVMTNQGGAGRMREPRGSASSRVSGVK